MLFCVHNLGVGHVTVWWRQWHYINQWRQAFLTFITSCVHDKSIPVWAIATPRDIPAPFSSHIGIATWNLSKHQDKRIIEMKSPYPPYTFVIAVFWHLNTTRFIMCWIVPNHFKLYITLLVYSAKGNDAMISHTLDIPTLETQLIIYLPDYAPMVCIHGYPQCIPDQRTGNQQRISCPSYAESVWIHSCLYNSVWPEGHIYLSWGKS